MKPQPRPAEKVWALGRGLLVVPGLVLTAVVFSFWYFGKTSFVLTYSPVSPMSPAC